MKDYEYCPTIQDTIMLTKSDKANDRFEALKTMCPCKVLMDCDEIWERVFEMAQEEQDSRVRYQIVHTLCDGSPNHREDKVISTLEGMWNDTDLKIRKQVRRVLNTYRRTGKWNIL
ncbi:hypothetical protein AKO1_005137 [Acrasis kona]|uniref:HEAT repeat domain-containing protein n=1 Tax=Acrasis kona TaxID=1008807 RepID=A0AAW2Z5U1_9EUKA